MHDKHEPLGEHKFLDLVHGGPDCFRGLVLRDEDEIVGYGHLSRHGRDKWGFEMVVTPDRRGGDLETLLGEQAMDVVAREGGGQLHWWVFQPTDLHDKLAARLGLQRGRDLLHMRVKLPLGKEPKLPEGFALRAFEPGQDEPEWIDVNNRAFSEHPEQGGWDRKMLDRRMSEPWFEPDDFLLAVDGKGIAGFCWTKLARDCGEIYVIGVDPRAQGTGLGKALAVAGLDHIASRGRDEGCLYVDSAERTPVQMYEGLGFKKDHVDRAYTGDIAPAAA